MSEPDDPAPAETEERASRGEVVVRAALAAGSLQGFTGVQTKESPMGVTPLAFRPNDKTDGDGLSVSRQPDADHPDFLSIDAYMALKCKGHPPEKHHHTVLLPVSAIEDVPDAGLWVKADPTPNDPGHALIPPLNPSNPKRKAIQRSLAGRSVYRVCGPFNCDGRVTSERWIDWTLSATSPPPSIAAISRFANSGEDRRQRVNPVHDDAATQPFAHDAA